MKVSLIKLGKIAEYILLILITIQIITGLGIVYYTIIEKITFGILTKAISFKVHSYLLIPLLIFLIFHIITKIKMRKS